MKSLTLHQPWASLIAHGVKSIETRSWAPPQSLVGQRIAIHAGKKVVGPQLLNRNTRQAIARLFGEEWEKDIPKGAVVATALLKDARQVGVQRYVGRVLASSPSYTGWVETRSLRRLLHWPVVVVPHGCGAVQPPGSCGGASGIVGLES